MDRPADSRASEPDETAQDVGEIVRAMTAVLRRANLPRVQEQFIQAAGLKLDRASYWLLRVLGDEDRLRLSELAARQGTDVSTVCRQIVKCEQLGLVEREGDPSDLRAVLFSLTEKGREALAKLQAARLELFGSVVAEWSDSERHQFAQLLQRFATGYLKNTGVH